MKTMESTSMAGKGSSKSNPSQARKRISADDSQASSGLVRTQDVVPSFKENA